MISAIQNNSRVENINGVRFYEQDILMCSYVYSDDIKIDITVDYRNSGFGVLFAEYSNEDALRSNNVNLLRIGDLEWSLIRIKNDIQNTVSNGTTPIRPSADNKENIISLTIRKTGRQLRMYHNGEEILRSSMPDESTRYRIGFYSNSENTIISSYMFENKPQDWFTNIENSNGGRIYFKRDKILFENGDKTLEVEQQKIKLEAGKYWLDFTTGKLNNNLDIKYYIFPSKYETLEIDPCEKNIINYDDNSFVLDEDTEINILFQCKSGEISNISIKDDINQSYISNSGDTPETKDGSKVVVYLDGIKKITWTGCIENVPSYNADEEPPYHIIKYGENKYTCSSLSININTEYDFSFYKNNAGKWELSINTAPAQTLITYDTIEKTMEFFYNISGYAKDIIVTQIDGSEINVLLQKTYKKYIPIDIESPVIVADENETPFDLSSDYRLNLSSNKYIFTNWCREYFDGSSRVLYTEKDILNASDSVIMYGIKDDLDIDKIYDIINEKIIHDISCCSKKYDTIASEYYSVSDNSIELSETIADKKYKYYVIDYLKSDSYCINIVKDNNSNDIYEVDISTDNEKFITFYDMTEDGQIRHYKIIDNIDPTDDYFISVKKEEDGDDD